ncbi:HAD family hydrolase [Paenibacillus sp. GCM10012307]|uniref:HAD hydrolase-like protein n=1 Tax=Paenibacillus roseus TaxID=2798579 RepID=A0A934J7B8_9BACL|nr:HAD hydrolase-like protein [Paenibacillus roseus]MBJ6362061.1 HAD hydrolase-like protein [Paenibacillus roseus]
MTQTKLTRPEAIIFDMDGTLFQTETLLEIVHKRLFAQLRKEGLYVKDTPPIERLIACLGMLLDDIWKRVMPDGSPAAYERANELMLQYELEELEAGNGTLYPHVIETLEKLHQRGIKLFVASNGLEHYVKGVATFHKMHHLFAGVYSAGEFETSSKVDLVARLLKDHHLQDAWMVGDRSSDVEAGLANGLTVIGCRYAGFGEDYELRGSHRLISSFDELSSFLP